MIRVKKENGLLFHLAEYQCLGPYGYLLVIVGVTCLFFEDLG